MPKPYKRENGQYRAQFRVDSVQYDKTFDHIDEAQEYIDTKIAEAKSKFFGWFVDSCYLPAPAFTDLGELSQTTYKVALSNLRPFFDKVPLADIRPAKWTAYRTFRNQQTTRLGKPPSRRTLNLERGVLIAVLKHAVDLELIQGVSIRETDRLETKPPQEFTTTADRVNLYLASQGSMEVSKTPTKRLPKKDPNNPDAPRVHIQPPTQPPCSPPPYLRMACRFLLLQFEFASRGGEVAEAKQADVDVIERTVRMRNTKNGTDVVKSVSVVSALLIRQQLDFLYAERPRRPNPKMLLFPSSSGTPLDYGYQALVAVEYGLVPKGFHTHMNRAGFVTRAFQKNATIDDVMNVTKHMSEARLRDYRKLAQMTEEEHERVNMLETAMAEDLLVGVQLKTAVDLKGSAKAKAAEAHLEALVRGARENPEIATLDAAMATQPVAPPEPAPQVPAEVSPSAPPGPRRFRDPFEAIRSGVADGKFTLAEAIAKLMATPDAASADPTT